MPYNKYMSLGTEARCGARFFSDSDDDHDAIQVICGQDTAGAANVSAPQRRPSRHIDPKPKP